MKPLNGLKAVLKALTGHDLYTVEHLEQLMSDLKIVRDDRLRANEHIETLEEEHVKLEKINDELRGRIASSVPKEKHNPPLNLAKAAHIIKAKEARDAIVAKLTPADRTAKRPASCAEVIAIRRLADYDNKIKLTFKEIGSIYGYSKSTILRIVSMQTYKNCTEKVMPFVMDDVTEVAPKTTPKTKRKTSRKDKTVRKVTVTKPPRK